MQKLSNFLIGIIFSLFLIIFAVFSIQNIAQISLKFFFFESIKLPLGILLCVTFSLGLMLGNIMPLLIPSKKTKQKIQANYRFKSKIPAEEDPLFDWE